MPDDNNIKTFLEGNEAIYWKISWHIPFFSEILFPENCPWEIKHLFKDLCIRIFVILFFKIETIPRVFTVNIISFTIQKKYYLSVSVSFHYGVNSFPLTGEVCAVFFFCVCSVLKSKVMFVSFSILLWNCLMRLVSN